MKIKFMKGVRVDITFLNFGLVIMKEGRHDSMVEHIVREFIYVITIWNPIIGLNIVSPKGT